MIKWKRISLGVLIIMVSAVTVIAQNELPEKPEINFVTIDSVSGNTTIDWEPSPSPGISTYKLYTLDIGTFPVTGTLLDSVPSGMHSYTYDPGTSFPFAYTVTAVDTDGNESLLSGDYHKPIKLQTEYDSCSGEMHLEWDKYIGWENTLTGYRVWVKTLAEHGSDGDKKAHPHEDFLMLDMVDTSTLSYVNEEIDENATYEYVIEAYNNQAFTSTSNRTSYFTFMPPPPAFVNLDYVTVVDAQTVDISISADISGAVNDFRVTRSGELDGTYTTIASLFDLTDPTVRITDNVPTQGVQYFYKVEALNSCRNPIVTSNTGNNIVARGDAEGTLITIEWTPYREFSTGVGGYTIYRKNQYDEFVPVSSTVPGGTSFTEDISHLASPGLSGKVVYFVEATEEGSNPIGVSGFSRSNEIVIPVETKIYLPNAFTPNGDSRNDIFIPILDFAPKEYKMFVFDRTGKALFRTTDPAIGWDGTLNGSGKAREGVYVYHIEYLSHNGVRQVRTGNLTLVYP